jgi:hypothetical protein
MVFLLSFIARALSTLPNQLFCYSAISSAAIVFILPGFIVRELIVTLTQGITLT